MTHAEIDALVVKFMEETARGPDREKSDPRVRAIVSRLLADLFKAIEDLDMTASEVWSGLDYLQECGQAGEIALVAAGLGLERFLDIRMDEAEARAGLASGTPRTIEGPLYVAGAPESHAWARLDDGKDLHRAEVLLMSGRVFSSDGTPVPGSRVEVWHANPDGGYSYFDQTQTPFNLRRTIITDEAGKYAFQSIIPSGYGCPPDGPTQALLDRLGRHGQRPAHIHFSVSAPGHRPLTTQITIDGDEYLWNDFAFAERDGLLPRIRRISEAGEVAKRGLSEPFAAIEFDFTLHPKTDAVPDMTVRRKRAEA